MPRFNDIAAAKNYLTNFYVPKPASITLANMRQLMDYLGNPQNKLKIIHVAGTSGKTSTTYFIAYLLRLNGEKVGHTVSPHIDEINERVQLNSQPIPEYEFCRQLEMFSDMIEHSKILPTYFEFMTAFAFWYFEKLKVDNAVVEVGLGGLNDATNVVQEANKICVITDIGLDHVGILGNSITEIAYQKAGIIQDRNTVIMHEQTEEVMAVVSNEAAKRQAQLIIAPDQASTNSAIPEFQKRNWNLAYAVYTYLSSRDGLKNLDPEKVRKSRRLQVPGRMEIRKIGNKTLIMDAAHNPQKALALADSFKLLYPSQKATLLVGLKYDKDYRSVAKILADISTSVISTELTSNSIRHVKSVSAEVLAEEFRNNGIKAFSKKNIVEAFAELLNSESDLLVITGSILLLGEVRKIIQS